MNQSLLYHSITNLSAMILVILMYIKALPIEYHGLFSVPNTFIGNVMASHVFRHTRLQLATQGSNLLTIPGAIQWQQTPGGVEPAPSSLQYTGASSTNEVGKGIYVISSV